VTIAAGSVVMVMIDCAARDPTALSLSLPHQPEEQVG